MRNKHKGETILVIGSGPSVNDFNVNDLQRFTTIGANQISRRFDPDYVTMFDTHMHMGEGIPYCMRSLQKSITFTSHRNYPGWAEILPAPMRDTIVDLNAVHWSPAETWDGWEETEYEMAIRAWPEEGPPEKLPYGPTSIGVCCWLAAYFGAARVGLIGVDMGSDYFFESIKPHATPPDVGRQANFLWERCTTMIEKVTDTKVYNLSNRSQITSIPAANFVEWCLEKNDE